MFRPKVRRKIISELNKCKGIDEKSRRLEMLSGWFEDDVTMLMNYFADHFPDDKMTSECLSKFDKMKGVDLMNALYEFARFHAFNEEVTYRAERIFLENYK